MTHTKILTTVRIGLVAACVATLTLFSSNEAFAQTAVQGRATCTPQQVSVLGFGAQARVHVFCSKVVWHTTNKVGSNFYFAVPSNDPMFSAMAAVLSDAISSNRDVQLEFASAENSNGFGCSSANCRRILSLSINQ